MQLLLDINIILDIVFERPGQTDSAALIETCGYTHQAWLAWHSVATLAYLIERQKNAVAAREVIEGLVRWARVATTGHEDILQCLQTPLKDLEDAMQVGAALACGADYIITRNGRDFAGAPVPALTPESFLSRFSAAH